MPVEIRVKRKFASRVQRARLRRAVERAMRAEHIRAAPSIYITGDAEMRSLNRRFHATDTSTDVLSFPAPAADYLGDVVISYERARAQARAAGWRIADELDLLAVHGTLHLLGYDDLNPRARKKMWKRQEEILERKIPDDDEGRRTNVIRDP
jgi:probable rRNA maturation factor